MNARSCSCSVAARRRVPACFAMAAEFLAQAGASRNLLSSLRGRPAFAQVSRNEKDRLHAMLLRAKGMAAAHLAELAEAIKQAEFAKPDEDALLDVISELAIQSSPSKAILPTRTALQDWQSLCNYFRPRVGRAWARASSMMLSISSCSWACAIPLSRR